MNKNYDVVSLGELLIDFTRNGESDQGNQLFEANPGGAPSNVLAILNKLGRKTAFIGKVGNDQFGNLLKSSLESVSIGTDGLIMDKDENTTLAFVHTAPDGDRDFSFYRKPGADMMLREDELNEDLLRQTRIFHFGSLSMTDVLVEKATKKAISIAKESGALISFDPNLREPLWDNLDKAKEKIIYGIQQCDVLKISDNELEFVTGDPTIEGGIKSLQENYDLKLLLVTLGKAGSVACWGGRRVEVKGFPQESTVDTTGAGDTFCGSALNFVLEYGIDGLNPDNVKEMLTFANMAAALVTTKKGALLSMPEKAEVLEKINQL